MGSRDRDISCSWIHQNHFFCAFYISMYVFLPASATLKSWCYISYRIVNNILIQNKTLTRNYIGSFSDISLSFTKAGVCASFASLNVQHVFYIQQCLFFSPGICYSWTKMHSQGGWIWFLHQLAKCRASKFI